MLQHLGESLAVSSKQFYFYEYTQRERETHVLTKSCRQMFTAGEWISKI